MGDGFDVVSYHARGIVAATAFCHNFRYVKGRRRRPALRQRAIKGNAPHVACKTVERRVRAEREKNGVPLDAATREQITRAAGDVGLPKAEIEAALA